MADQRFKYKLTAGKSLNDLIQCVEVFLKSKEHMEIQYVLCSDSNYTVLQARTKHGNIKQFIGMDKALTIRFVSSNQENIIIEFGEAKWVDKGAVMLVSMFVLWPLTITSGVGMYHQGMLPQKIKSVIDEYLGEDNCILAPQSKIETIAQSNTVSHLAAKSSKIVQFLSKMIR